MLFKVKVPEAVGLVVDTQLPLAVFNDVNALFQLFEFPPEEYITPVELNAPTTLKSP